MSATVDTFHLTIVPWLPAAENEHEALKLFCVLFRHWRQCQDVN